MAKNPFSAFAEDAKNRQTEGDYYDFLSCCRYCGREIGIGFSECADKYLADSEEVRECYQSDRNI